MEVSHFELLFKPQSPVPPADIVLQGYFLEISNLEDQELFFRLDFVTSVVTAPTRTLAGNTLAIVDVAGTNNDFSYSLLGSSGSKSFRLSPSVTIPAHATALVAVLPKDPFPLPIGDGTGDPADYEARGYVKIGLPPKVERIDDFSGPFGLLRFVPQIDRPARVLLTPQNRATYFRNGGIGSQTQASLPLGRGTAVYEVEPERGLILPPFGLGEIRPIGSLLEQIDLGSLPAQLAELLGIAAAAGVDTQAFNRILRDAGIGLALERRDLKPRDGQ